MNPIAAYASHTALSTGEMLLAPSTVRLLRKLHPDQPPAMTSLPLEAQPLPEPVSVGEPALQRRCSGVNVDGVAVHATDCDLPQGPAPRGVLATHGASDACLDLTIERWGLSRERVA